MTIEEAKSKLFEDLKNKDQKVNGAGISLREKDGILNDCIVVYLSDKTDLEIPSSYEGFNVYSEVIGEIKLQ